MTTQHRAERTVPVERLRLGDHACMGPGDIEGAGESPWKVFTAYTRTSLARGEKVLLVMDPDDLSDDEVVTLLDRGSGQVVAARAAWSAVAQTQHGGLRPRRPLPGAAHDRHVRRRGRPRLRRGLGGAAGRRRHELGTPDEPRPRPAARLRGVRGTAVRGPAVHRDLLVRPPATSTTTSQPASTRSTRYGSRNASTP